MINSWQTITRGGCVRNALNQFLFLDYFILFLFFCYFTLLLIFTKIILLSLLFYYISQLFNAIYDLHGYFIYNKRVISRALISSFLPSIGANPEGVPQSESSL